LAETPIVFVDAAAEWGLAKPLQGIKAHAACCGDVNGDGTPDLYIGTFCDRPHKDYLGRDGPVPNMLFLSKDGKYVEATTPALTIGKRTSGSVFADLDNDGDLDLYIGLNTNKDPRCRGPNCLFENVNGQLRDVSEGNAACVIMGTRSIGVLDYDGDGLLDLLVTEDSWRGGNTKLFHNLGKLQFEETTEKAGLPKPVAALGVVSADLNFDGYPDLFLSKSNKLFLSNGKGGFRAADSSAFEHKLSPRHGTFPCGVTAGDLDRDGDLDLVTVDHLAGSGQHLYLNLGLKAGVPSFREATKEVGLDYRFAGKTPTGLYLRHDHVSIQDFDNDGWPDILVAAAYDNNGTLQPFVCRNLGLHEGKLRFSTPPTDKVMGHHPAGPIADYDRDGRIDVMLASWFPELLSNLFLNRSPRRHWLQVRAVGKTINRMGIGCKVRLYRAGKIGEKSALLGYNEILIDQGFCTGHEAVAHFGLGRLTKCDVEVELPFGKGRIVRRDAAADQALVLSEE